MIGTHLPLARFGAQLLALLYLSAVKQWSLLCGHQQHLVTVFHLNHTRRLFQQQDGVTHALLMDTNTPMAVKSYLATTYPNKSTQANSFAILTNQIACMHSSVQWFHLVQVQRWENHTSLIISREQFHPIGAPRQRCDGTLMEANYIKPSQLQIQRKREKMMELV